MIKLTFCLARRPELSREEFQDYWRNTHAPLVKAASEALGIRRYIQSHTVTEPRLQGATDVRGIPWGDGVSDYDGVAELWFDSLDTFFEVPTDKALLAERQRHAQILVEDEAKFIDQSRSRLFLVDENVVVG